MEKSSAIDIGRSIDSLPAKEALKVYKIRWLVLAIFVAFSASNAMQWIQFSIISDVVVKYYGVTNTWVDWTSMIYMVLYIPFIFPASYLLEKLGLRNAIIIGIVGTCGGAWIKMGAIDPNRAWVAFLGQSVVALSQIFVISVPARLAAVWFGPSQVSSACSIGVFGNQLGVALGFVVPPTIVRSDSSHDELAQQFTVLYGMNAGITTVILILILIFFKNGPPTPPSIAAAQQTSEDNTNFVGSLKNLATNRSYILLLIAYGINVGVFYAISTLLNQIITHYYENASADAGRIGLVIVVAGMLGSVCCGVVLDAFHKYKETTLIVYACSLIGMVIYTFTLSKGIVVVYIVSALLGFFMTGLLPVGFELAVELTYPEPEGTSAGLLNFASNLFGIIFTNIYSSLFYNVSCLGANILMSIMLAIGTLLLALTSSDLRRQAAHASGNGVLI